MFKHMVIKVQVVMTTARVLPMLHLEKKYSLGTSVSLNIPLQEQYNRKYTIHKGGIVYKFRRLVFGSNGVIQTRVGVDCSSDVFKRDPQSDLPIKYCHFSRQKTELCLKFSTSLGRASSSVVYKLQQFVPVASTGHGNRLSFLFESVVSSLRTVFIVVPDKVPKQQSLCLCS